MPVSYDFCALCRFTRDTESVDTSVSYSVQSFMTCSISVFGAIIVVTAVTPAIIVAVAALSIVYYRVQVQFLAFPVSPESTLLAVPYCSSILYACEV